MLTLGTPPLPAERRTNERTNHPPPAPLAGWERWCLYLLPLGVIAFGVLVEIRSSFLRRHMTDLDVYLRAAWAVRAGADIYDITDDNHWHYHYPPLLAILLTPLAHPPAGVSGAGTPPFAVSAAIWYVLNVACLFLAVHLFARALEEGSADAEVRTQAAGGRRWWHLRLFPILVCLAPVGHTLMRGQVSLLLLLCFAGMARALGRRQGGRAGLWLAGAICLKVIPAVLLLLPLWRRDWRCLGGCALGLALGLGAVPAAVFGWERTVRYYAEYDAKVLRPGMGDDQDKSRAKELMEVTATDSQSLLAVIHNTLHLDRGTRPVNASPAVRRWHWLIGGALTLLTLAAAGRGRFYGSTIALVLFLGALVCNMLLLSPVCHLHYFCLLIPLVAGLLASAWEARSARADLGLSLIILAYVATSVLPLIPGFEVVRDAGLAAYGALALWASACVVLWRRPTESLPWAWK